MNVPDKNLSVLLGQLAAEAIDPEVGRAQVFELAYGELREIADRLMRSERAGHTLQPTALVNEAYVRLAGSGPTDWKSRAYFFGVAARAMRQLLVHHALARNSQKRGGKSDRVTLESSSAISEQPRIDVLSLDDALSRLAELDERGARVVELRFFGGLNLDEIAAALGVSRRTVQEDWAVARRWLRRELRDVEG